MINDAGGAPWGAGTVPRSDWDFWGV